MSQRILLAVDLEDPKLTDKMLKVTKDLAGLHGGAVTLIHVANDLPPEVAIQLPDDYRSRTSKEVSDQLSALVDHFELPSGPPGVSVRFGAVYREILAQARIDQSDLIIIGCHQPDLADFLLGPNAARVVRHATCSVYVVR